MSLLPPRVRLLGLSYILVFGASMVQVVVQPRGDSTLALGALMVMGGLIVIAVVALRRAPGDEPTLATLPWNGCARSAPVTDPASQLGQARA